MTEGEKKPALTGTVSGWTEAAGAVDPDHDAYKADPTVVLWDTEPGEELKEGDHTVYGWYQTRREGNYGTNYTFSQAPGTLHVVKAATPVDPGTKPTEPTQPTDPGTKPTEPTDPGTKPTEPTQPTDPGTKPTERTDPGTKPTEPTDPGTKPTQPTNPPVQPQRPAPLALEHRVTRETGSMKKFIPDDRAYNHASHDTFGSAVRRPMAGLHYERGGTQLGAEQETADVSTMDVTGVDGIVNLKDATAATVQAGLLDLTQEEADFTVTGADDVPAAAQEENAS